MGLEKIPGPLRSARFQQLTVPLWGRKKVTVLGFNFVLGSINMNFSILVLFCRVVLRPVKITYRDDPSKRGSERTSPPVVSGAALPTVSISASEEVWGGVCCVRHASKGTFWICSSSPGRERSNLFEVFIVLIFFFYLASLRILPASVFAHFLWFVCFFFSWAALIKPSWIFAMKFQWMCSSKANAKFAVSYNMFNAKS